MYLNKYWYWLFCLSKHCKRKKLSKSCLYQFYKFKKNQNELKLLSNITMNWKIKWKTFIVLVYHNRPVWLGLSKDIK